MLSLYLPLPGLLSRRARDDAAGQIVTVPARRKTTTNPRLLRHLAHDIGYHEVYSRVVFDLGADAELR